MVDKNLEHPVQWQDVSNSCLRLNCCHGAYSLLHSGSVSLSDDGVLIAISNLMKGFDIYRMVTEEPVTSFEHNIGQPMLTPVLFTHRG